MNRIQAQSIADLYQELLNSIGKSKIVVPEPTFRKDRPFSIGEMFLEDGQFTINWSRYEGCGEYEHTTTYQSIDSLFED